MFGSDECFGCFGDVVVRDFCIIESVVLVNNAESLAVRPWQLPTSCRFLGPSIQERKKHINIKKYPENPPVRVPP